MLGCRSLAVTATVFSVWASPKWETSRECFSHHTCLVFSTSVKMHSSRWLATCCCCPLCTFILTLDLIHESLGRILYETFFFLAESLKRSQHKMWGFYFPSYQWPSHRFTSPGSPQTSYKKFRQISFYQTKFAVKVHAWQMEKDKITWLAGELEFYIFSDPWLIISLALGYTLRHNRFLTS